MRGRPRRLPTPEAHHDRLHARRRTAETRAPCTDSRPHRLPPPHQNRGRSGSRILGGDRDGRGQPLPRRPGAWQGKSATSTSRAAQIPRRAGRPLARQRGSLCGGTGRGQPGPSPPRTPSSRLRLPVHPGVSKPREVGGRPHRLPEPTAHKAGRVAWAAPAASEHAVQVVGRVDFPHRTRLGRRGSRRLGRPGWQSLPRRPGARQRKSAGSTSRAAQIPRRAELPRSREQESLCGGEGPGTAQLGFTVKAPPGVGSRRRRLPTPRPVRAC